MELEPLFKEEKKIGDKSPNYFVKEGDKSSRPDPTECPHISINRVMDTWRCNKCGAEFVPVVKSFKTKWTS